MNYIQKFWNKIILNSVYYVEKPTQEFRLYDPRIAENISEHGRQILADTIKRLEKEKIL